MSDPWRLDGRIALVIGAGRGLGRGCALELARAGARVVLVARTESELAEAAAAAGNAAVAIVADATDPSEVERVVRDAAALGELGVLVVAAGTNRPGPARDYPMADWDLLFELNVRATFLACQAFGDALLTRGARGAIVTMSSQLGSVGYPGRVAYCATALTFVETPLTKQWLEDPAFRAEVLERRLPTGRLAEIDDVAHAVRYLACDASNNVTGHILKVDGGWTAW
jgi:NAD(P)-dependent dehydrogenase (short-subunit alcohol dehydrogenase family)